MIAATEIGEIILFEHPNFGGAHRHVFQTEKHLGAPVNAPGVPAGVGPALLGKFVGPALGQFDNTTSSIIVVKGTWRLYEKPNLENRLGDEDIKPGGYPSVSDLHISGNIISSLELKSPSP